MNEIRCAGCGKRTLYALEKPAFCAHCARKFDTPVDEEVGRADVRAAIARARNEADTAVRHTILMEAKAAYGDDFEIERELLYLGRLYERGGKPDFYRIPYWPLCALERPEEFSKKDRGRMLDAFFKNPEYERVCALAPDPEVFKDEYFGYMASEYVKLFIAGNQENATVFGFRRRAKEVTKRCARAMAHMLLTIKHAEGVSDGDKPRIARALYEAFVSYYMDEDGERALLDALGDDALFDFMKRV